MTAVARRRSPGSPSGRAPRPRPRRRCSPPRPSAAGFRRGGLSGDAQLDTVGLLAAVERYGVRLQEFTGVAQRAEPSCVRDHRPAISLAFSARASMRVESLDDASHHRREAIDLIAQLLTRHDVGQRQSNAGDLAGEELGVGLGALGDLAVVVGGQRGRVAPGGSGRAGSAAPRTRPATTTPT